MKIHDHFIKCCKSIGQNSTSLHVKSLEKIRNSRPIPTIVKAIYSKPIASIKLNGEKLEAIPLKSGTTQGCLLSPYRFNMVLEVPKNSTTELLKLINNSSKVAGYKINSNKSVAFLYSKDKQTEKEIQVLCCIDRERVGNLF